MVRMVWTARRPVRQMLCGVSSRNSKAEDIRAGTLARQTVRESPFRLIVARTRRAGKNKII